MEVIALRPLTGIYGRVKRGETFNPGADKAAELLNLGLVKAADADPVSEQVAGDQPSKDLAKTPADSRETKKAKQVASRKTK